MKQVLLVIFSFFVIFNIHAQRQCHMDVFVEVAGINGINTTPLWLNCTEDEPSGNPIYQTSDYYDIYKMVKGTPYNVSGVAGTGPEYFWSLPGCCGEIFCIDDNNLSNVMNGRIKLTNVNVCYNTTVWVDIMTQCEDCNDQATPPNGRWWKRQISFMPNQLAMNTTIGNALVMTLTYQGLAGCEWNVTYGCDDGEGN